MLVYSITEHLHCENRWDWIPCNQCIFLSLSRVVVVSVCFMASLSQDDDDSVVEVPLVTAPFRPPAPWHGRLKDGCLREVLTPQDWKLKDWCPDKCTSKIIAKFLSAEAFNLQRLLSSNTLQSPPQRSTTPTTPSSAVIARVPAAASAGTRTGGNTDELGSSWIPIISRRYASWFSYIGTWNWIKIQWPRFHEWFSGT